MGELGRSELFTNGSPKIFAENIVKGFAVSFKRLLGVISAVGHAPVGRVLPLRRRTHNDGPLICRCSLCSAAAEPRKTAR